MPGSTFGVDTPAYLRVSFAVPCDELIRGLGALVNFLDNAREHAAASDVTVDLAVKGEDLVLGVADRGPGVPEDRLERIFERFTNLDPSRSGGSSGLGLASAAEHAALLGGYLQAMNREGGGLRLELVMPLPVTRSLPAGHRAATHGFESGTPTTTTRESES